ncbi:MULTISPECIES: hypothetical protein [Sphingobacterium]|uniref:hypothetical protein n=1 Tax=Sphingobacterium TaxID=28453 RepID=UPI0013DADC95|nr:MULTISPECIES: hypothetical protein [unclassified Sphingobacterium]
MIEGIEEAFNQFITSSFVTKLLLFISAFFAPVWELYILLMFLVIVDYLIDLGVWMLKEWKSKRCWEITQPFVIKVIMYSILVITVNAVQQHLIKEAFDFFKLIIAIPITAQLIEIVGTVERTTGIALVDKVKDYLSNWIGNKESKKED